MKIITAAACVAILLTRLRTHNNPIRWRRPASGPLMPPVAPLTPPMGWNSWNAFASAVDEEKVMGSAKRIVDSGLARKGYRYINLDDGWAAQRRVSDGHLMIRADKFPSTAKRKREDAVVQAVHRQAARHGPQGRHLFGHGPQHLRAGMERHG